jgi:hypothetical protein
MIRSALVAALLATALPTMTFAAEPSSATSADHDRDRASIKAMAGTYKVTFDMRETVPFTAGYTPLPSKLSGGHEVVRVIVDTPDFISLQHLLVVDTGAAKPMVVKHWRQDWTWQPKTVLTYAAASQWVLTPVSTAERKGAWSQTVWQTDDSPRYGAIGHWRYDDGVARWTSAETRRPLARRDATRHPPYDHYVGINRHALTPIGWVHEQDNAKIGQKDGASVTFVHESVINSYVPATDFPIDAADTYWSKTKEYWAQIRTDWDEAIRKNGGVHVTEEADNGSTIGHELMLLADDVATGEVTLDTATKEAGEIIAKETSAKPAAN